MNDIDRLVLLSRGKDKENALMKAKNEINDTLDRLLEEIRAQIKELEKSDD